MSAGEGGPRAIVAALAANAGIAVAKFVGFVVTGSSSMLAESVHSLADTVNQALLLLGRRTATRRATKAHPFGFGRERFLYGFVVALLLFTLGAVFALYEGVHKVADPHRLDDPLVAVIILVLAMVMEGFSFRTAIAESRVHKGDASWWRFIRDAKVPELPLVLAEDTGALIGLVFALCGVGLSQLTGDPVWDGIGTLAIGSLLGVIALTLIVEMKSLLIGEGADQDTLSAITDELVRGRVTRVIHIRTQYIGPDELLVAAKIALVPSLPLRDVATAIDDAEARVRSRVPTATLIYLEPDLDRNPV